MKHLLIVAIASFFLLASTSCNKEKEVPPISGSYFGKLTIPGVFTPSENLVLITEFKGNVSITITNATVVDGVDDLEFPDFKLENTIDGYLLNYSGDILPSVNAKLSGFCDGNNLDLKVTIQNTQIIFKGIKR